MSEPVGRQINIFQRFIRTMEDDWDNEYYDKICESSAADAEEDEIDKEILEEIKKKERELGIHQFSVEDHFRSLLDSPDGEHCVFGEVVEGEEVISKLNNTITDTERKPYQDIRITHTVVLHDPYDDPPGLKLREKSPEPTAEMLASNRIGADESLNSLQSALTEMETAKKDELNSAEERLDAIQQEKYQQVLKIEKLEQAKESERDKLSLNKVTKVEESNDLTRKEEPNDNDEDEEFIRHKKKHTSESAKETHSMLKDGLNPNQICSRRGYTRSTILGHLAQVIQDPEVEIDPKEATVKIQHIVSVGRALIKHPFLKDEDLKSKVGCNVPWGEFKFSLAYLMSKTNTIRQLKNLVASLETEDERIMLKEDNITRIQSKDGFNK